MKRKNKKTVERELLSALQNERINAIVEYTVCYMDYKDGYKEKQFREPIKYSIEHLEEYKYESVEEYALRYIAYRCANTFYIEGNELIRLTNVIKIKVDKIEEIDSKE